VASNFANVIGEFFAFNALAALAHSGARFLQCPHLQPEKKCRGDVKNRQTGGATARKRHNTTNAAHARANVCKKNVPRGVKLYEDRIILLQALVEVRVVQHHDAVLLLEGGAEDDPQRNGAKNDESAAHGRCKV